MIIFNESAHALDLMTEGGEGRIYEYEDVYALKIYKDSVDKEEKREKLQILMKKRLPSNIIGPLELVYDINKEFSGFMMKKVRGEEFKRLSSKKFVISNNITKDVISDMLMQVKETIKRLHSEGIYIGDLNDLNILFDKRFRVYFIDIDSWSVGLAHKCTVANELFKDPNLVKNNFNQNTDQYAFAVLIYKALTRLHPFGGVIKSNRQINTLERMMQNLSVFNVSDIIIPPMVDKDCFFSSKLINDLRNIFVGGQRFLVDENLDDFGENLKYCKNHQDYYYSLYNKCPICELDAKEKIPILKIGMVGGIPIRRLLSDPDIRIILDENIYIDKQGFLVFRTNNRRLTYEQNALYFADKNGDTIYKIKNDQITIRNDKEQRVIELLKAYKSMAVVRNNTIYYITKGLRLAKFEILEKGESSEKIIGNVSINNIFEVIDENNYFICNIYEKTKIVEISGYNYQLNADHKIEEYGLHLDPVSKRWLFIYEDQKGNFYTFIFDKNKGIVYETEEIRYIGLLGNLCFYNDTIYTPSEGVLTGYNYEKQQYKEFEIPIINSSTKLIKRGKKFIAINEREIFEIG